RASGGIGRRAGFRCLCPQGRGGSSPPSPTPARSRGADVVLGAIDQVRDMRIVISNFGAPCRGRRNFNRLWRRVEQPPPLAPRESLFAQRVGWGFHIYAIGVHLMDLGIADRVEFWDYQPKRTMRYLSNGVLDLTFSNHRDVAGYLNRFGPPDLFVNYGSRGIPVLELLEGQTFRVQLPCYLTTTRTHLYATAYYHV